MISLADRPFRLPTQVAVLAALGAAFYLAPLPVLITLCVASVMTPSEGSRVPFLILACVVFTALNISKEIAGDLTNYVAAAQYLQGRPVTTLLNAGEFVPITGSYRITEIGFYGTLWALANTFGSARLIIAVCATLAIYVPVYAGLRLIAKRNGWSESHFLVIVIFVFFAAINFTQTTHLLRQYVSSSLLFLGFSLFIDRKPLWAIWAATAACMVHNGSVLLVADIFLIAALFPRGVFESRGPTALLLRMSCALAVSALLVGLIFMQDFTHMGRDEGRITIWHYVAVTALFIVSRVSPRRNEAHSDTDYYSALAFVVVILISATFFVFDVKLLALRYFSYLEWIFGLLLGSIFASIALRRLAAQVLARWVLCAFSIAVFIWRINASPWAYGPGGASIFELDLPALSSFLTR